MYGPVIQGATFRLRPPRQEFCRSGGWVDLVLTELLRADWEGDRTGAQE